MRRVVASAVVAGLALAAAACGAAGLRTVSRPIPGQPVARSPRVRVSGAEVSAGPFVVGGGLAAGPSSGLWGDGSSGAKGTSLGCLDRRHYSEAFGIENRLATSVTLIAARGPNPTPAIVDLVAVQLRLSPPARSAGDLSGGDLAYRHWSAAHTGPVTIPPGRIATVQANFLLRRCGGLASGRAVVVPGSFVVSYRVSGRVDRQRIRLPGAALVVTRGPTRRTCAPVAGSVSLVAANTTCALARKAALACHPMSHNSWGDCTVERSLWDCGSTAGPGAPYLETCWHPTRKSDWLRVRWNPPALSGKKIGGVRLGLAWRKAVGRLSELFGARSSNPPRNRACGPGFTEVAWQHLYVEFERGRLAGFRYIADGWPPGRAGERATRSDRPPLVTSRGITLGSTLGQARAAYGRVKEVGTNRWETPDGLVLYDNATHYPDPPSSRIVEIRSVGTCGDF